MQYNVCIYDKSTYDKVGFFFKPKIVYGQFQDSARGKVPSFNLFDLWQITSTEVLNISFLVYI